MMAAWDELLENPEMFTSEEAEYLDVYTLDALLLNRCMVFNTQYGLLTRDGGPHLGMPYVTRLGFMMGLGVMIYQEPVCT